MAGLGEKIQEIFGYRGNENLVERALLQGVLDGIGVKAQAQGLVGIGLEGAVIKALAGREAIAVKIASPELLAKGKRAVSVFSMARDAFKSDESNPFRRRWIRGCEIQRQLAGALPADSVLYVPRVISLIPRPLTVVMEFCEGVSILRWISERKNFREAMLLYARMLRAIAEMHAQRIIHRDLKPENLIITGSSVEHARIGLVDWTLAKFFDTFGLTATTERLHIGTAPYASPKLMLDGNAVAAGPADDIFSVGVMLAEFCSFRKVRRPENIAQVMREKIAFDAYISRLSADVNFLLRDIFRRATATDEAQRYNTVTALLHDFERKIKAAGFFDQAAVYNMSANDLRDAVLQHARVFAEIKYLILKELGNAEEYDVIPIDDDIDFGELDGLD